MSTLNSPLVMGVLDSLIRGLFMPSPPDQPDIGGRVGLAPPPGQQPGQQPEPQPSGAWSINPGVDIFGNPTGAPEPSPHVRGAVQGTSVDRVRAGPDEPYNIPTLSELDAQGREAITGQYESELGQFEEGQTQLTQQKTDVEGMREEKKDQLVAARAERTQQIARTGFDAHR